MVKHKHKWKVIDYDDTDPGIILVECKICKKYGKAVMTKEDFKLYKNAYMGDYMKDLMYLPDLEDEFDELIGIDAKALGIKT